MPLVRKGSQSPPPPPPSLGRDALLNGSKEERWSAARTMTQHGDVPALGEALSKEGDASVREAIFTSLCRIGTVESAGAIVDCVRSDDASVRRGALDALRSMPQAAASHLPGLLADDEDDVRLLSCEIARELPSDQATALLSELLRREQSANVCGAAVEVLTEVGTEGAVPVLQATALRFEDEPFLQFAIEAAIERITDARRG